MNIQTEVKMMVRLNKAATVDIYEAEARTHVQPSGCSVSVPMSGPGRPPTSGAGDHGQCVPVSRLRDTGAMSRDCWAHLSLLCDRVQRVTSVTTSTLVCSKYPRVPHSAQEITFYISPP